MRSRRAINANMITRVFSFSPHHSTWQPLLPASLHPRSAKGIAGNSPCSSTVPVRDRTEENPWSTEHPFPATSNNLDLHSKRELFHVRLVPWGWRHPLGLAGVLVTILCLGSLLITETPASLIEQHQQEKGLQVLKKIKGADNVQAEFYELIHASEMARQVKHTFRNLMKRNSRPQLVIDILMQTFQQFTGIKDIFFYALVLFQTMGFKNNASLLSSVITGLVNVFSTVVSVVLVDKVGREALLLQACVQMLISQGTIGRILGFKLHDSNSLARGWAITVASIFFFFGAWIVVVGLFVVFLLPETKGIAIDEMTERVWKQHSYWKRFMDVDNNIECELSKIENGTYIVTSQA
ncbi:hypothetical protein J5N97_017146 [Dioscorea zingiberensis]|uniref:Uncharacterized protein n=1 Tax=Dioscorea zingiberensis TaxID=325984 RepID=A0A9D5HFV3_9LILI|nr:hypothetical protein J5N97_017146 [Dioscorea zingiberensis]